MKVTFLGTGTSYGVPMIGCECRVCTSDNPKNARTRSSVLISEGDYRVLIDAATELRIQCLKNKVKDLDAVLLTHSHADHVLGFDDLRHFNRRRKSSIPVYGSQDTINSVSQMFSYAFSDVPSNGSKPKVSLMPIDGKLNLSGIEVIPVEVMHGQEKVTAYRFDKLAYVTDVSQIPQESVDKLQGLDLLIIAALRNIPHEKHFSIEQAISVVSRLKPKQTFFTHIAHEIDHEETDKTLPPGIQLAYDGLAIEV